MATPLYVVDTINNDTRKIARHPCERRNIKGWGGAEDPARYPYSPTILNPVNDVYIYENYIYTAWWC
jgi:hypothetical protein